MDYGTLLGAVVSVLIAAVGAVVWLVRLEGRLNVLHAQQTSTDKRVDGLEERIVAQLDRIESRLDTLASR